MYYWNIGQSYASWNKQTWDSSSFANQKRGTEEEHSRCPMFKPARCKHEQVLVQPIPAALVPVNKFCQEAQLIGQAK